MDTSETTINPTFSQRYTTFFHAVLFVLGFSLVFVIGWGGAATLLGRVFGEYKQVIARIGGIVIIIFGLNTLGLLKIPWLAFYSDTRPQFHANRKNMAGSSLMMGIIFAAGWTPCVGTTLGAILTLGFAQDTSGQAMILASGYCVLPCCWADWKFSLCWCC